MAKGLKWTSPYKKNIWKILTLNDLLKEVSGYAWKDLLFNQIFICDNQVNCQFCSCNPPKRKSSKQQKNKVLISWKETAMDKKWSSHEPRWPSASSHFACFSWKWAENLVLVLNTCPSHLKTYCYICNFFNFISQDGRFTASRSHKRSDYIINITLILNCKRVRHFTFVKQMIFLSILIAIF